MSDNTPDIDVARARAATLVALIDARRWCKFDPLAVPPAPF